MYTKREAQIYQIQPHDGDGPAYVNVKDPNDDLEWYEVDGEEPDGTWDTMHKLEAEGKAEEADAEQKRVYQALYDAAPKAIVALPHHCGSWVIGGPAEVRQLIQDLQIILIEMAAEELKQP